MKMIILGLAFLAIAGCGSIPEEKVVYKQEYIVRTASPELKELPDKTLIAQDLVKTDADGARWLVNVGKYIDLLEGKFTGIIEYYERPIDK